MLRIRTRPLAASLLAILVAGLVLSSSAFAIKTLALSSGAFSFEVAPGETGKGEVTVINDGDEDIKVMVYVADVKISETGEQEYVLPERSGAAIMSSPSTWMRVYMPEDSKAVGNTPYLELKPGQRIPVRFDFSPPRNATPGDHNVVMFFEMFDFLPESAGSASQVTGRIGARVQLRVTGDYIEKIDIRPFEVPAFVVGNSVPYKFTVNNTGNVNERLSGLVSLLDRSKREVISSPVASDTPVYAASSLQMSGEVTSVASVIGPHTVEARFQYLQQGAATPTEAVASATVWMIPLWLIIAVAAVVVLLVVWATVRGIRRRGPKGPRGRDRAADVAPVSGTDTGSGSPTADPSAAAPVSPPVPPSEDYRYDAEQDAFVRVTPQAAPVVQAPIPAVETPAHTSTDATPAPSATSPVAPDAAPAESAESGPEQDALQLDFGGDE